MELVVTSRETDKNLCLKIRQTGGIPAVIYSGGKSLANIVVDAHVFSKFLSSLESGALSSTIFLYLTKVVRLRP